MKIGILTFHWGTNYGGILQAYALQDYLTAQGHSVEIINFKPKEYDFSWIRILKHPSLWGKLPRLLSIEKKELLLNEFRESYLRLTQRFDDSSKLSTIIGKYDVIISGSDQVLNPSFTCSGDNGKPSPVYWLGLNGNEVRRLGYAVSFGCEVFPEDAAAIAKKWINDFNAIGVREDTGLQILEQLCYKGPKDVLPDPTLLIGRDLFSKLGIVIPSEKNGYTCVYMLRHEVKLSGNVKYIDEIHKPISMKQWLQIISNASHVVTNSYHGMIISILAHVPFAVLLETGGDSGMNDRFYTLLGRLEAKNRIASTLDEAMRILSLPIDFGRLDILINDYRMNGVKFLKDNI